jgi:hypothetical protein
MNRRNQADLIAADIEYRKFTHLIGGWKGLAKVSEGIEVLLLDYLIPSRERRFSLRILIREFIKAFPGDYMHDWEMKVLAYGSTPSGIRHGCNSTTRLPLLTIGPVAQRSCASFNDATRKTKMLLKSPLSPNGPAAISFFIAASRSMLDSN